ncbi:hypothetical protein [Nocardia macrotermitis]|uniref:Uncharacterized protein n=1 Tax=Nocardia macrotermitis TaxID=2585198 RepID=A0A7K0DFK5_9NOCA|nr:hypothetical protein [Nocardia macrotermitis]MQY24439.1 hypothetical protein [Nocardia macrotermitis]
MTEQPPWQSGDSAEQRKIDEQIAAKMGISLERLYEIDRQVAADVEARDAIPQDQRTVSGNPKFSKGFGPVTPENSLQPGEIGAYYDAVDSEPDATAEGNEFPEVGREWPPRSPRTGYEPWTRFPVFYYPVTRRDKLLGYLYASVSWDTAGFLRNLPSWRHFNPFSDPSGDASEVWEDRLDACYAKGMSAQDAVRSWVGVAEDSKAGGIAADVVEGHSETLEGLNQSLNPGGPEVPNPWIQNGMYPDGTPVDRSEGWGDLVSAPVVRYPEETKGRVAFYPVTKEGGVLGWVWAAMDGDAADYIPFRQSGWYGFGAGGLWIQRLSEAFNRGDTPLEALEYCRTFPEDNMSGLIEPDAPIGEFDNLQQMRDWADQ